MKKEYKNQEHKVYIGLGGNQGDRSEKLKEALLLLNSLCSSGFNVSPVYETPPWGFESDQSFLNCCVEFNTLLTPQDLLLACHEIEKELGRERESDGVYASRTMDIDILYYDRLVITNEELTIPHPRIYDRNFVLYPLSDIAPTFEDPIKRKTILELKKECNDRSGILLYTNKLLTFS